MPSKLTQEDLTDSVIERFWKKVDVRGADDCWEWVGALDSKGYGVVMVTGATHSAHRLSWILHNGDIPDHESYHGMCVCHACDNPRCVNPAHLWLGTNQENNRDMNGKGRAVVNRGELCWMSKLTEKQVREIREKYIPYTYTLQMLADEYHVTKGLISGVVNFKIWKHVN